jgi:non-specific serine/threonine protein kinase
MAAKQEIGSDQVARYWGQFGEKFLLNLLYFPDPRPAATLTPPPPDLSKTLLANAPPMPGREYLSEESLSALWRDLAAWVNRKVKTIGGFPSFLAQKAPKWRSVGRLVFHLAETDKFSGAPFAFMLTRVSGLTNSGQERHEPISLAMVRLGAAKDRESLARLLAPIRKAAQVLPWVAARAADGSLYQPSPLTLDQAYQFLVDSPILEKCGLVARLPNWWRKRPQIKARAIVGERKTSLMDCVFDFKVQVSINGQILDQEEFDKFVNSTERLVFLKGEWVEVDRRKLDEALKHWAKAQESYKDGLSFAEAMRLLAGAPSFAPPVEEDDDNEPDPWNQVQVGTALNEILSELNDPKAVAAPSGLKATLRPYQAMGLAWLTLLSRLGLGACLADDMGLGKTMQVLAWLLLERDKFGRKPSLLVAPASLLANWRVEAEKFAPDLRLIVYHHSETPKEKLNFWRQKPEFMLKDADLVITSYALASRGFDFFSKLDFRAIIVDEAQAIKNQMTAQSRAVRKLNAKFKVALTGTPIENDLGDLWSIFDFLNPGLLGSSKRFKEYVARLAAQGRKWEWNSPQDPSQEPSQEPTPTKEPSQAKSQDPGQVRKFEPIKRLISPYVLRRLKTDKSVIADLPDKTEMTTYCWLTQLQAKLYAKVIVELKKILLDFGSDHESQFKRRGLVLSSLLKLKQICNHPAQVTGDLDWDPEKSGKFIRVGELAKEIAIRGEKVLIFSQFKAIIDPLEVWLAKIFGRPGLILHGGTPVGERRSKVEAFQDPKGPPFFLLTLKAGGTGLNLTAAAHVVHFDRWWNPAVEDQATDRAYRVGQNKNVLAHKLVTRGTVEERIEILLKEKRGLAEEILNQDGSTNIVELDDQALLELISLDLDRALLLDRF